MTARKNLIEEIFNTPYAKIGPDHYVALFAQSSGTFGNVVSYELKPEHIEANPHIDLSDPLVALELHADPVEIARWKDQAERSAAIKVVFQAVSAWPAIPKGKSRDDNDHKDRKPARPARRSH